MDRVTEIVGQGALRFEPVADGMLPLLDAIGDASMVLIGEASHGTHEFYEARAELTKALISTRGFSLVAVEADWPDAYRVNRWVRQESADSDADAALDDFVRFPRWMWRNRDVVDFLEWLHAYNAHRPASRRVGFYGLDLYSLHASVDAVLSYLRKVDPEGAERARHRYACFEGVDDPQAYGYAATLGVSRSCEDEVVAQLKDLRRRAADYAGRDGRVAADDYFYAEQNARLVRNAEQYYRAMFGGRVASWNLRDTHMMETLDALMAHVGQTTGEARAVVWAHNSHVGDARATRMGEIGELNLGQLARQGHGAGACLIGFTTHTGTVTAASDWGEPVERKRVRPSLAGSYERVLHQVGMSRCLLLLRDDPRLREALMPERLERAIGVIYRPDSERSSHYFGARLPEQFDAVLHIDETSAVEPLERWALEEVDLPETYPYGI
jgi:erythromycin esterase-like protein